MKYVILLLALFYSTPGQSYGSAGYESLQTIRRGENVRKLWLSAGEPLYKQIGITAYSQYEWRDYQTNYNRLGLYRDYKRFRVEGIYVIDGAGYRNLRYDERVGVSVTVQLWK